MECLLQYLDDLDDLYWAVGLKAERIRNLIISVFSLAALTGVAGAAAWAATLQPQLALTAASVMSCSLVLRAWQAARITRQAV